jgi:hypothetical protein
LWYIKVFLYIFHTLWRDTGRKTLQKRGGGACFPKSVAQFTVCLQYKISSSLLIFFSFQVSSHVHWMILFRCMADTPLTMNNMLSYTREPYEENCTTLSSRWTSCRFVVHKVTVVRCVGLGASVIL